jgi:ribulose-5-phosphate 4-epimerase/fuculose-1-phosphate aldolase
MKVIDDGVIKYDRSNFSYLAQIPDQEFQELEFWRNTFYKLNLIGEYPEIEIGFGNISMFYDYSSIYQSHHPQFIITGTQTGKYNKLTGLHYTRVIDYDINQLQLVAMGPIEASSEALTHAAIYSSNPEIKAVVHIHSNLIWNGMIEAGADCTSKKIPYGTREMAQATLEIVRGKSSGVFAMLGHEDGIISYGKTIKEASELMLNLHKIFT